MSDSPAAVVAPAQCWQCFIPATEGRVWRFDEYVCLVAHVRTGCQEPGSNERRWGLLSRYDEGRLIHTKSINEDAYEVPAAELNRRLIDPEQVEFSARRGM